MKLQEAKAQETQIYAGHGIFLKKAYDPKNTKVNITAAVAADAKMKDLQLYHVAYPRTPLQLEACLFLSKYYYGKGAPVVFLFFSGKVEGEEK